MHSEENASHWKRHAQCPRVHCVVHCVPRSRIHQQTQRRSVHGRVQRRNAISREITPPTQPGKAILGRLVVACDATPPPPLLTCSNAARDALSVKDPTFRTRSTDSRASLRRAPSTSPRFSRAAPAGGGQRGAHTGCVTCDVNLTTQRATVLCDVLSGQSTEWEVRHGEGRPDVTPLSPKFSFHKTPPRLKHKKKLVGVWRTQTGLYARRLRHTSRQHQRQKECTNL